jgi:hypothetical protein
MDFSYNVSDSALNHPESSGHEETNWISASMAHEHPANQLFPAFFDAGAENDPFSLNNPLPLTQPSDTSYQSMALSYSNFRFETFLNQLSNILQSFNQQMAPIPAFFSTMSPPQYQPPFQLDPAPASVFASPSASANSLQVPLVSSFPQMDLTSDSPHSTASLAEVPPLPPNPLQGRPSKRALYLLQSMGR